MMLVSSPVGVVAVWHSMTMQVLGGLSDDNQDHRQRQRITAFLVIIAGSLEVKSVLEPFLGSAVEQK